MKTKTSSNLNAQTAFTEKSLSMRTLRNRAQEDELFSWVNQAQIIQSSSSSLTFIHKVAEKRKELGQTFQIKGKWAPVGSDLLLFETRFSKRQINLRGTWKLGTNHELTFVAQKLDAGLFRFDQLVFSGKWDLEESTRLSYRLTRSSQRFIFNGRIVTLRRNSKGRAEIQFALDLTGKFKLDTGEIEQWTLTGTWKPISTWEIGLEIRRSAGKSDILRLQGRYKLDKQSAVSFILTQKDINSRPEMAIQFKREAKDGAEFYLRIASDLRDSHFIGVGGKIPL